MFCTNCGTQVKEEARFCSACGSKINAQEKVETSIESPTQPVPNSSGTVYVVLGWIFFGISLLFIPILFGAGAFIMGYLVRKSGQETHGTILMILAIAGAIFGTLLGMAVAGY
jgi:hypothetical protein